MYDQKSNIIFKITNIAPFGAFCDLKDAACLIDISEFSDFFVRDIWEFVIVDDNVEVEVLDFDPVKKHVKLSYKIAVHNYWKRTII
ncbi:MAG: S1 RNA-binding domain-containing protein [Spiroplasma phoeniceum]|nr:MAG: S1 RNA-binding domain-containing protein [Spiroplasma phoeniceum]UZQ33142.1 MAG: S1 RNA-binding domain-containing protein [Spiroplasma phoeniceum]